MQTTLEKTDRTRARRAHKRATYDLETIYSILDNTLMCHVGYIIDGSPIVMPTIHWREGNTVYWHASSAGRGIRAAEKQQVCLTAASLDGLVLARSALHHSANYRSVMVFGQPHIVTGFTEKAEKLRNMIEHIYPGRWETLRPITAQEVKATTILGLDITEASAKIRAEGVHDDPEDISWPTWAGVIPFETRVGTAEPDAGVDPSLSVPDHWAPG